MRQGSWKLPGGCLLLLLAVAGCGGDLPTDTPKVEPPDTTFPGNASTATSQQRMAALDMVQGIVAALPGQNFAAETQQLVSVLRLMPQFAAAGASADGTVWARFTNGMAMYIVHSPLAQEGTGAARADGAAPVSVADAPASIRADPPLTLVVPGAARAGSRRTHPGTVPGSKRFRLFDGIGPLAPGVDPRAEIEGMLTRAGYEGTRESATLPALRSVSGDGIFYIRTHGGLGSIQRDGSSKDVYALWTASAAMDSLQEARDATLLGDLAQNRVVYMLFRISAWPGTVPLTARHYGITEAFISNYMSFAPNSLIYVDACNGAVVESFRAAFASKNASVFASWTERSLFAVHGPTASYVFDRLLGSNTFAPESPRQRPFPYDVLTQDPKFGRGRVLGYSRAVDNSGAVIEAELVFDRMRGEFGILAPSIHSLRTDEKAKELYISGYFGNDPDADGRVTINDGSREVALAVISWTHEEIRADLPQTGAGSSGNVIVSVRDHPSNPRQLLEWSGEFIYTMNAGTLMQQRFEFDVRARVDPQDVREAPAEVPRPTLWKSFMTVPSTQVRFSASGLSTQDVGNCRYTSVTSGSGTITAPSSSPSQEYQYSGSVDMQQSRMEIGMIMHDVNGLTTVVEVDCGGMKQTSSATTVIAVNTAILTPPAPGMPPALVPLTLDAALTITAGQKHRTVPAEPRDVTYLLQWPRIDPRPSFNPTLPR